MLAGLPAPRIRVYPRYTVVAEKFEAIVSLGMANSRLKDYFDLWVLLSTQALPDGHPNSPTYGHLKLPHLN